MPDHHSVYSHEAEQYERLVAREDYFGNIPNAIRKVTPPDGLDVVETGAGTGRLTCMLASYVKSFKAFDSSSAMLQVARSKLDGMGCQKVTTQVADHRSLPVPDQSADLLISGWSIGYLVDWNREAWPGEVEKAFQEMQRILRSGGWIVLLETQGTGFETPHPPQHLLEYYAYLQKVGFTSDWFRTDYRFESVREAVELSTFFFGTELGNQVLTANSPILPECTGIWWKQV
jgi:ubiquinone/menaquinone biosynthesis C-methylase UbiE